MSVIIERFNTTCAITCTSMAKDAVVLIPCTHHVSLEGIIGLMASKHLEYSEDAKTREIRLRKWEVLCPLCRKRVTQIYPDRDYRNALQDIEELVAKIPADLIKEINSKTEATSSISHEAPDEIQPVLKGKDIVVIDVNGEPDSQALPHGSISGDSSDESRAPSLSSSQIAVRINEIDNVYQTRADRADAAAPPQVAPMSAHVNVHQVNAVPERTYATDLIHNVAAHHLQRQNTPPSTHDFNEVDCYCIEWCTYGAQERDFLIEETAYGNEEYARCFTWGAIGRLRRLASCILETPIKAVEAILCGSVAGCLCIACTPTSICAFQSETTGRKRCVVLCVPCLGTCAYTATLCAEIGKNVLCCLPNLFAPELAENWCGLSTANRAFERSQKWIWDKLICCKK